MMELGVLVLHGRVRHPQTQGKMERFNRTEKASCFSLYDFSQCDFQFVRERITGFLNFYNFDRPHEALAMDVPRDHYHKSERKFCRATFSAGDWEYPSDYCVRTVRHNGYFMYKGRNVFFSEAFEGKRIAYRKSHKPGCITLFFREFRLGRYNYVEKKYEDRVIRLVEGDPRDEARQANG